MTKTEMCSFASKRCFPAFSSSQLIIAACVWLGLLVCSMHCCDIYVASKCSPPPGHTDNNVNYTLYCNQIKEHIDCINHKLKSCKNVQEFGPALETIKWNIKVLIQEGQSHGCTDLKDKIKLPRIPRKKPTSPKTTTEKLATEKAIVYIDPNCHRNLADMYCERLESQLMKYLFNDSLDESAIRLSSYVDETSCKKSIKYGQCLQQNFLIRCPKTLKQTFVKIDRVNAQCNQYKAKTIRLFNGAGSPKISLRLVASLGLVGVALSTRKLPFFLFS